MGTSAQPDHECNCQSFGQRACRRSQLLLDLSLGSRGTLAANPHAADSGPCRKLAERLWFISLTSHVDTAAP